MTARRYSFILYIWVGLLPVIAVVAGIGMDYVFNDDALRMRHNLGCGSQNLIEQCEVLCDGSYVCISRKCYCLDQSHKYKEETELQTKHKNKYQKDETYSNDDSYEDLTRMIPDKLLQRNYENKPSLTDKPALRHHIAHFCPNLEEARTCIRGCMKYGKPAFCGKDHVCYCGHKYDTTDENEGANVENVHDQFRDLYLKYFGSEQYKMK